jgi:hypothetical protein
VPGPPLAVAGALIIVVDGRPRTQGAPSKEIDALRQLLLQRGSCVVPGPEIVGVAADLLRPSLGNMGEQRKIGIGFARAFGIDKLFHGGCSDTAFARALEHDNVAGPFLRKMSRAGSQSGSDDSIRQTGTF